MVQLFEPSFDPVFITKQSVLFNPPEGENAEASRAWAKHFAPVLGAPFVSIPKQWADFFTAMLMNPGSFEWAKSFLSSSALEALHKTNQQVVHFALPEKCPNKEVPEELAHLPSEASIMHRLSPFSSPTAQVKGLGPFEEDPIFSVQFKATDTETKGLAVSPKSRSPDKGKEVLSSPSTPPTSISLSNTVPAGPWSKAFLAQAIATKSRAAIVDTEVRRSIRKKEHHKGYKHNMATCDKQNCLGCVKGPPILSPSVIKNLGESFCKIESDKLTEKALTKKRKVAAPSGKAPGKVKIVKPKEKDEDDQNRKNNNKKQANK
ncbi:unnamed protein product [Urochloa humidicola]